MLAVNTFHRKVLQLLVSANVVPSSHILITVGMAQYIPPKHLFLQEPHGVVFQNTEFFKVTALKT
jgi:hypothetical protein